MKGIGDAQGKPTSPGNAANSRGFCLTEKQATMGFLTIEIPASAGMTTFFWLNQEAFIRRSAVAKTPLKEMDPREKR
jgi:hypothetical protein